MMNMVDIILWVIVPYLMVAIVVMSFIWRCDFSNDEKPKRGFKLKGSLIGFLISGLLLFLSADMSNIFSLLYEWLYGLLTLNPNMDQLATYPLLYIIHWIFGSLLIMNFLETIASKVKIGRKRIYIIEKLS
ncbi:respiratory nitrate reductase subunit gamma [Sutcliffiella cohnii]|uniref:respiratory nitrate reductase subunit gamma n=1 Tax=Sutcliffiella sp. NC1 TaxID=3004096 RepID=UPI0022DCF55E|nr:respiratory nitrate reductase subunit gamma [Sutcliffiella sp. NC1]WBL16053.1 respiratory nitrate reductase subunit gamma [Sutcliffiella sp. NC1]